MGLDSVVTLALGLGTGGTAERRLRPGPGPRGCPAWGLVDQRGHMQDWVPPSPPEAPRQQGPRQGQIAGFSQVLWQGQVGKVRGSRNPGPPFRYLLYDLSLGPWTPQHGPKPLTAHPTKQPLPSSLHIREVQPQPGSTCSQGLDGPAQPQAERCCPPGREAPGSRAGPAQLEAQGTSPGSCSKACFQPWSPEEAAGTQPCPLAHPPTRGQEAHPGRTQVSLSRGRSLGCPEAGGPGGCGARSAQVATGRCRHQGRVGGSATMSPQSHAKVASDVWKSRSHEPEH